MFYLDGHFICLLIKQRKFIFGFKEGNQEPNNKKILFNHIQETINQWKKKIGDAVFRVGDRRQFGQLCT